MRSSPRSMSSPPLRSSLGRSERRSTSSEHARFRPARSSSPSCSACSRFGSGWRTAACARACARGCSRPKQPQPESLLGRRRQVVEQAGLAEQILEYVALGTEDSVVAELAKERQRLLEGSAFIELAPLLDRQTSLLAQRLDGLHAAKVGTGGDPCDLEPRQEAGQSGRLAATYLVERPQPVVALPFPSVAGAGMADDEQRHCP